MLFTPPELRLLARARKLLEERLTYTANVVLDSPQVVREYLALRFAGLGHEEFHVLFVDSQNLLIAAEAMFRGTLTQASVYPREVLKQALAHNAAGVILAHNHPSGKLEPSAADRILTETLKQSLKYVDVTVLDHVIVAGPRFLSFAEKGML